MEEKPVFFRVREEFGQEVGPTERADKFRAKLVRKLIEAFNTKTFVVLDTRGSYGFTTEFIDEAFGDKLTNEFNQSIDREEPDREESIASYIKGVLPIGGIISLWIKNKIQTGNLAPKVTSDMF